MKPNSKIQRCHNVLVSEWLETSEPEGSMEKASPLSSLATWETEAQRRKGLDQGHTTEAGCAGRKSHWALWPALLLSLPSPSLPPSHPHTYPSIHAGTHPSFLPSSFQSIHSSTYPLIHPSTHYTSIYPTSFHAPINISIHLIAWGLTWGFIHSLNIYGTHVNASIMLAPQEAWLLSMCGSPALMQRGQTVHQAWAIKCDLCTKPGAHI